MSIYHKIMFFNKQLVNKQLAKILDVFQGWSLMPAIAQGGKSVPRMLRKQLLLP